MQTERRLVNLTVYTIPNVMRIKYGLFDLPTNDQKRLSDLIESDFDRLSDNYMDHVCEEIALMAYNCGANRALVEPPPFLCARLEWHLFERDILPYYALSRINLYQEEVDENGHELIRTEFQITKLIEAQNKYKLNHNPYKLNT